MNGTERIGWDQDVIPGTRVANYQFVSYVDGVSVALQDANCVDSQVAANAATCSAGLPKMTPGSHSIQLAAIRNLGGPLVQSDKSAPLVVVQLGSSAPAMAPAAAAALPQRGVPAEVEDRSPAGNAVPRVDVLARGLHAVADVAVGGSNVFVAERGGTVRLVSSGELLQQPALVLEAEPQSGAGFGLLSIALHPDYVKNGRIYLLYTASTRDGTVYRIAAGREVGGKIGELSVLVDNVEAFADGWAVLRFGPDAKLYAAFPSIPDADATSGYAGHILRLNDDGTIPDDNPVHSAAVAAVGGVPLALEWNAAGLPSVLLARPDGSHELTLGGAAGGASRAGGVAWRSGERPASVAHYQGTSIPRFIDRLIVPMLDGGVEAVDPAVRGETGVARRFGVEFGAARAVAVSPDGIVYVGTANGDMRRAGAGAALDVLLRIRGASAGGDR